MNRIFSLAFSPRFIALTIVMVATAAFAGAVAATQARRPELVAGLALFGLLTVLGLRDLFQTSHAVLRNYPISAHLRFLLEEIRPEMRQYFFEDEKDGMPFSRDSAPSSISAPRWSSTSGRSARSCRVYADGYEWMQHSMRRARARRRHFRAHDRRTRLRASPIGLASSTFRR